MLRIGFVLGAFVTASLAATASHATIIYTINRDIGAGSVTGFVETDGTLGILGEANIVDWSLTLDEGDGQSPFTINGPLSGNNSELDVLGDGLSATLTELLFDFSGMLDFVLFQNPVTGSGINYWCAENSALCAGSSNSETVNREGPSEFATATHTGLVAIGTANVVPEPSTLALFGCALAGLGFGSYRRRRG
jgi:hypothetical protein